MSRKLLVVARCKPLEALRVAAGLTLADAQLQVVSLAPLPEGEDARVQLEALEFAEVTVQPLPGDEPGRWRELARAIVASDIVYML